MNSSDVGLFAGGASHNRADIAVRKSEAIIDIGGRGLVGKTRIDEETSYWPISAAIACEYPSRSISHVLPAPTPKRTVGHVDPQIPESAFPNTTATPRYCRRFVAATDSR